VSGPKCSRRTKVPYYELGAGPFGLVEPKALAMRVKSDFVAALSRGYAIPPRWNALVGRVCHPRTSQFRVFAEIRSELLDGKC
jgi:hypothetical protein